MALTDTAAKNTKHSGKPAGDKLYDTGGLYLLVKAAGRYWRMDYRFAGKRKTLALGIYPAVSLAQALFYEWLTELELELRSGDLHPAMESHLGKYRKLIPALALIFALIDTPDSPTVGKTELLRALAWGDYLRSHAERIYSAATRGPIPARPISC